MSKIQLLVDEFDSKARDWGWESDLGTNAEIVNLSHKQYNNSKKALLNRIADLEKSARIPLVPNEGMIRAARINQCADKYDTYEDWEDSHSSGIVETIRKIIVSDYIAMMKVV